jgi:hypothetical protein
MTVPPTQTLNFGVHRGNLGCNKVGVRSVVIARAAVAVAHRSAFLVVLLGGMTAGAFEPDAHGFSEDGKSKFELHARQ